MEEVLQGIFKVNLIYVLYLFEQSKAITVRYYVPFKACHESIALTIVATVYYRLTTHYSYKNSYFLNQTSLILKVKRRIMTHSTRRNYFVNVSWYGLQVNLYRFSQVLKARCIRCCHSSAWSEVWTFGKNILQYSQGLLQITN